MRSVVTLFDAHFREADFSRLVGTDPFTAVDTRYCLSERTCGAIQLKLPRQSLRLGSDTR